LRDEEVRALPLILRDPGGTHEVRVAEEAGHALLAPADLQPFGVFVLVPVHGQSVLFERGIEGRQVPVALGVGKHTVAVEDQRSHQARPELPKSRMCSRAISFTAAL
jgi:hypothetical protein